MCMYVFKCVLGVFISNYVCLCAYLCVLLILTHVTVIFSLSRALKWDGVVGAQPTLQQLQHALEQKDLYMYD